MIDFGKYYSSEMNTIYAPWWKLWLARLFGDKRIGYDSGYKMTCYQWRGKIYVTKCELDTLDD